MAETPIHTTCAYCGVGCGLIAKPAEGERWQVEGDKEHPANFGRLCSKGAALAETIDLKGRQLHATILGTKVGLDQALDEVAQRLKSVIAEHGPEAVAFYVSGQLLTEDYYVANKLIKGFIGTANIDTNSRLCMASAVAGHKRVFGTDTVPQNYQDLDQAELVVMVGSNLAWCHPVLYQRLVEAKERKGQKWVVIDPRQTATAEQADHFLALKPGTDIPLFQGLLVYLADHQKIDVSYIQNHVDGYREALAAARDAAPNIEAVAQKCDLSAWEVKRFYQLFADHPKVVTAFSQGVNQSSEGTNKVVAILNCHLATGRIGKVGAGPFSITGQPNAMGGREVGGLANQLAAHRDFVEADLEVVRRFWNAPNLAQKPGLKAVEMFDAVREGKIKFVWIMATNPAMSLPNANAVREALARCPHVIVSDLFADTDSAKFAHVFLPAAGWGEKDGTVTNSERRISRQRAFLPLPGDAKPDWWLISQIGQRLGHGNEFSFQNSAAIFREHAALSGFENHGRIDFDIGAVAEISDDQYQNLTPFQWPIRPGEQQGQERFFARGGYFTPNQRAKMLPIQSTGPAHAVHAEYPFILNSGRVRDQWHSMTRTARSARLNRHRPEPFVEINPADAQKLGLHDGALAEVSTAWGRAIARVRLVPSQRVDEIFMALHWSKQNTALSCVDHLINPATDPYSGQPEFKHTPAKVTLWPSQWQGLWITRQPSEPHFAAYWALMPIEGALVYFVAGQQSFDEAVSTSQTLAPQFDNHMEYLDRHRGQYRMVGLVQEQVNAGLFLADKHAPQPLPDLDVLIDLFNQEQDLSPIDVLAGRAALHADTIHKGRQVCACFNVGLNQIIDAIQNGGLKTAAEVGATLKAGTNCGSCLPEIKEMLSHAQCPAAA